MSKTSWINEQGDAFDGDLLRLDDFDHCVVGLAEGYDVEPRLVYDKAAIISTLVDRDGMSESEAEAHFSTNILGSYYDGQQPLFIFDTPDGDDAFDD